MADSRENWLGLGRLPHDLSPHVEQALAESEATLRETLKQSPGSWEPLRKSIETAMTTVLEAFRRQASLAVQRGVLTVTAARAGGEECLDSHAYSIYQWLQPLANRHIPHCPYGFERYSSDDLFRFRRDIVDMMHSSETWLRFLRDLATPTSHELSSEPATPLTWRDVTIRFVSDLRIQAVVRGENKPPLNYDELGFADGRNGQPRAAWATLRAFAESDGVIASTDRASDWRKVEKRVEEIRERLRQHFGITTDPIPYDDRAYRAQFRLERRPSYDA